MKAQTLVRELFEKSETKIVMLVADGLGGLPMEPGGKTELETAHTPNLDALVVIFARSMPPAAFVTAARDAFHQKRASRL